jgi:hypothetical protein
MKRGTSRSGVGWEHPLRSVFLARAVVVFSALMTLAIAPACDSRMEPLAPSADLDFSVTPSVVTVAPGQTAIFAIRITSKENINARVTLSAGGLFPGEDVGLPITIDPQRLSEAATSSTMQVGTTATSTGDYTIWVTAVEDGATESLRKPVIVTVGPTPSSPTAPGR